MSLKAFLKNSRFPFGIYILLIIFIIAFFIMTGGVVSPSHILNIARTAAPLGVAAIGQTLVLLVGGIDLSVGCTMSMVNLVMASIMVGNNQNTTLALFVSLALSILVGFANGFIITKFKMQPFLVTLAISMIVEGGYYVYTEGIARGSIAPGIRFLSEGWIGAIPIALILWVIIWFLCSFLLRRTVYGHKLYMAGANIQTAKLSGFHAEGLVMSAYILAAILAWFAGVLLSGYVGVASVGIGSDYTLNSIASTVIGGTAFTGGVGSLEGTFPGVLIITLLTSLMTILGIPEAGKFIAQGVVIAVTVAINQLKIRK